MGKREALVEAYMAASPACALYVLAGPGGRPARFSCESGEKTDEAPAIWFAKPGHAELVLMTCREDFALLGAVDPQGWIDLAARTVRDHIVNVASLLGAAWRSEAEMRADASVAVEKIIASVEAQRQSGGLSKVNAAYKIYRQQQLAKGEKAIPYSAHLAAFTRSLVVLAAANVDVI